MVNLAHLLRASRKPVRRIYSISKKERNITKHLIIHAGYHKTGTTSLQFALHGSREALKSQGILYPYAGCPSYASAGHHLLPWSLKEHPLEIPIYKGYRESFTSVQKTEVWDALRQEIDNSDCHTVIISSEEFDNLTDVEVDYLKAELSSYELTIVIFLRRFDNLIDSIYRTSVLVHDVKSSAVDIDNYARVRLDISNFLSKWASISKELRVYNFDKAETTEAIYLMFFGDLGINYSEFNVVEERLNESLPATVTELVRQLNISGASPEDVNKLWPKLNTIYAGVEKENKYSCLDPDMRQSLLGLYVEQITKASEYIDTDSFDVTHFHFQLQSAITINSLVSALSDFTNT